MRVRENGTSHLNERAVFFVDVSQCGAKGETDTGVVGRWAKRKNDGNSYGFYNLNAL